MPPDAPKDHNLQMHRKQHQLKGFVGFWRFHFFRLPTDLLCAQIMEFVESKDGQPLFSAVNVTNVCATMSGAALSWRILFGPYDVPWEVDTATLKLWFPKVDWLNNNKHGVGSELGLVDAAATATIWLPTHRWGAGLLMKEYESELAVVRRAQESTMGSAAAAAGAPVPRPSLVHLLHFQRRPRPLHQFQLRPICAQVLPNAIPSSDVKGCCLQSVLILNPVLEAESARSAAKSKTSSKGVRRASGHAVKREYRVMARNRRVARRGK